MNHSFWRFTLVLALIGLGCSQSNNGSVHSTGGSSAGAGGNADWRIRAEAASKSFRIERRTGEKWQGIAGFSVAIGDCRPPPPPAPTAEPAPAPQ